MTIKKLSAIGLSLAVLLGTVGCTTDDTGLTNNRDRLSTQTRITDNRGTNNNPDVTPDTNINNNRDNRNNNNMLRDNNNNTLRDNNDNLNNGMVRNNNNDRTRAKDLTNKIEDVTGVDNAHVILTNNSCIVGLDLDGNSENLEPATRDEIREIIDRNTNVDEDNISITTDPNMIERITALSQEMGNNVGEGLNDFTDDIENLMNDILGTGRRNIDRTVR